MLFQIPKIDENFIEFFLWYATSEVLNVNFVLYETRGAGNRILRLIFMRVLREYLLLGFCQDQVFLILMVNYRVKIISNFNFYVGSLDFFYKMAFKNL